MINLEYLFHMTQKILILQKTSVNDALSLKQLETTRKVVKYKPFGRYLDYLNTTDIWPAHM